MPPKIFCNCFLIFGILFSKVFANNPEVFLEKGNMELDSGNLLVAEDFFNKALSIDPSFAPALKGLSKLSLHKGDLKKANEYAIDAVQKDEDFREWSKSITKISENIQNGNRNVQQGLFDEAINSYELILQDHPY